MRFIAVAFCLVGALPTAAANELYESFDDVSLGRLFLSPAERRDLEARRGVVVDEAADSGDVEQAPAVDDAPPARRAAGYIVGRDGRALVWSGGAFRPVAGDVDDVDFPGVGRIRIERGPARDSRAADRRAAVDGSRNDGAEEADVVDPP